MVELTKQEINHHFKPLLLRYVLATRHTVVKIKKESFPLQVSKKMLNDPECQNFLLLQSLAKFNLSKGPIIQLRQISHLRRVICLLQTNKSFLKVINLKTIIILLFTVSSQIHS